MTFSMIARCPKSGRVGISIATYSVAVGQWCDGVDAKVGVTMSQAFVRYGNNALALNLLRQGFSAPYVVDALKQNDPHAKYRQIAAISADGAVECYTGPGTRGWAGHDIGEGFVAMGNVLRSADVVSAMAQAYRQTDGCILEERMLAALEAGRDAGGQGDSTRRLSERSAALIVSASDTLPATNLRVDLHCTAVEQLRRVYAFCNQYAEYYRHRGVSPEGSRPQEEFEATLSPLVGGSTAIDSAAMRC